MIVLLFATIISASNDYDVDECQCPNETDIQVRPHTSYMITGKRCYGLECVYTLYTDPELIFYTTWGAGSKGILASNSVVEVRGVQLQGQLNKTWFT